jgi:uncharacterized protein YndB with AHSA1/START domain
VADEFPAGLQSLPVKENITMNDQSAATESVETLKASSVRPFDSERELSITRLLDAPCEAIYRCWTEPELVKQWFAPKPWTVSETQLEVRPGGKNNVTMRSPEGQEMPTKGIYLDVIPNRKLVFTDAFDDGEAPKDGPPFMLAIVTFEDEDGKTRYTARARHWSKEAKVQHEQMGFHTGWNQCADQLEALARTL